MSARILVAGVGNIFLGDDGFGCEVVRRLASRPLPPRCEVVDFGIRGLHLAHALLTPCDLLVLVDAVHREEPPGTVYLLAPNTGAVPHSPGAAHGMDLPAVFASVRALGGSVPRTLLVACEPLDLADGIGLSEPVEQAVGEAVRRVEELVRREAFVAATA